MILHFYRESTKWYIDLPDWNGDKEDLEMVLGADDMLDELSHYGTSITLQVQESKIESGHLLMKISEDLDGATYLLDDKQIWICSVTKFLFDTYPQFIWIKVINRLY